MPETTQFYNYTTALAERIEEIATASTDAESATSSEHAINRLLMGDIPPFSQFVVLFGDTSVTIPLDVPRGYAKSYIDWELLLVGKYITGNLKAVMDFIYQKLHHYKFPVPDQLEVPIDRALTCYFEGWDPEERLTDELRVVPFHIRIVTLDPLV